MGSLGHTLGCVCLATPMLHSGVKVGSLGCVCLATPMLHSGPRWVRPSTHNRSMPPCPLPPPPSHHTQTPPPPPFNNVQVRVGVWACGRVGVWAGLHLHLREPLPVLVLAHVIGKVIVAHTRGCRRDLQAQGLPYAQPESSNGYRTQWLWRSNQENTRPLWLPL